MKRYLICFSLAVVFCSCQNQEAGNTSGDADTVTGNIIPGNDEQKIPAIAGCYLRALNRDTLAASLEQNGDRISGRLAFDNYQKDGSTGTVEGRIENGVVKLVYRFQSEGMSSISEVYFKIEAGQLIHGYGEVAVKGDSAYFPEPRNITYKDTLFKISCSELRSRYW